MDKDAYDGGSRGIDKEPQTAVEKSAAGYGQLQQRAEVPKLDEAHSAGADSNCVAQDPSCEAVGDKLLRQAQQDYFDQALARGLAMSSQNRLDPVTESQRLERYSDFTKEAVDPVWSASLSAKLQEGVLEASNATPLQSPDLIECRSSTCLLRYQRELDGDSTGFLRDLVITLAVSGVAPQINVSQSDQFSHVYLSNIADIVEQ